MGSYVISLQEKWWERMCGAFWLIAELSWKFTIDIGVWWELQVATTNSIWIWWDQWKSIVRVLAICLKELVLSVGQVEIVCQFHWDRVSISFRALNPRSSVDFVEIVCRFRQNRVSISPGVRWSSTQIWKSSPRWRIIGWEEIKYIKKFFKLIGRYSRDIGSQKERGGSLQHVPEQGPVEWRARRAQAQPGRPPNRPWQGSGRLVRSTDWHKVALGWSWSTEDRVGWPPDRRVLLSWTDSDSFSILGSNSIWVS